MSTNRKELLREVYDKLFAFFGPLGWWPAETPFEVILGAILTQNTAWKNVAAAIGNLRSYDLLSFERLCGLSAQEIAPFIRSSGFYNEKAKKIKTFCTHILTKWGGGLGRIPGSGHGSPSEPIFWRSGASARKPPTASSCMPLLNLLLSWTHIRIGFSQDMDGWTSRFLTRNCGNISWEQWNPMCPFSRSSMPCWFEPGIFTAVKRPCVNHVP